jgi:hypothetical protein
MTGLTRQPENDAKHICVIGAGPRGISVIERILANAAWLGSATRPLVVHVVDPYPPGPGGVWRTSQSEHLLMNTIASQVTLFTDGSVACAGPPVAGPTLYDWARMLAEGELPGAYPEEIVAEAGRLGPDSYPTRRFHGHYLEWVFRHLEQTAPEQVTISVHRATAVALDDTEDGRQAVTLLDGTRLTGLDVAVLVLGHGGLAPTPQEHRLRRFAQENAAHYVGAASPADADLSWVRPGMRIAMRGLGLTFFDYLALLTEGWGGRFERGRAGLVYRPSGAEPVLVAGSRRGVPYHARGENQKGALGRHEPRFLTADVVAALRRRADSGVVLTFRRDIWPLIDREVRCVYYHALIRAAQATSASEEFVRAYPHCSPGSAAEEALLDRFAVAPGDRWSWEAIERPYGDRIFTDGADFRRWLLDYLRTDVAQARLGNVSGPVKAAVDAMRDLRNEIRILVDYGGIAGGSYQRELEGWYNGLNAFTSIGPPVYRIEQMIALMEAGLLDVVGPGMRVTPSEADGCFLVDSPRVPDRPILARGFIEARVPEVDLRRSANPLLRYLHATGRCRPYRLPDADGPYESGGVAVTESPPRLLDWGGRAHPRRFAFGVPIETVRWVTAVGIRPGVGSVTLEDSDAIARAALEVCGVTTDIDGRLPERAACLPARSTPRARMPAAAWFAAATRRASSQPNLEMQGVDNDGRNRQRD